MAKGVTMTPCFVSAPRALRLVVPPQMGFDCPPLWLLKRITMAGSGEWPIRGSSSNTRRQPDVENGQFRLTLGVGSRRSHGRSHAKRCLVHSRAPRASRQV